jgi:putative glycosyltransferase (TIGR04372 family)
VFSFLGLLCAVPTILILWILKPVFWLKVGILYYSRIGHLALNTDLFLRRRQLGVYPDGPYYCFMSHPDNPANRQLLNMFKRVVPIYESKLLCYLFTGMLWMLKRTPFYQDLPMNSNEYYEFTNAKPSIYFTPDEIEKGHKLLGQMNVDINKDEFVCIFARDDAYLKSYIPYNNWDYQKARNSDIDSIIETAKYLIEKGLTVIRVGSVVNKPINFTHKKMVDYSHSKYQSDFLDIFLLAHCKFLLAAGSSGLVNVANVFDKPSLIVNLGEHGGFLPFAKNCLYIPKKYKYSKTGDYLHFEDALKLGPYWLNPTSAGLETEETSPQDILEAAQEMLARTEGRFRYSPESEKLIQAYHKLWGESDFGENRSNVKTPIGLAWLKKNRDLYFS